MSQLQIETAEHDYLLYQSGVVVADEVRVRFARVTVAEGGVVSAHLHAPSATAKTIHAGTCPDCKKRSRFLSFFTPWYGAQSTCLQCGREWSDGEWMPLPFCKKARKNNIATAKSQWRAMPPVSANYFESEKI